jgi:hypothetical protein
MHDKEAGTGRRMVSEMKKTSLIKDITVEWEGGVVRGFRSIAEAERYIRNVCKRIAPEGKYSIYKYL